MTDTDGLRADPIQARSHRTRDALLDAARGVLATYGEDEVTTALVAERAHKSIGTVYRYYADRAAILNAILPGRAQSHEVLRERARQVELGYTAAHDDRHGAFELLAEAEARAQRYRTLVTAGMSASSHTRGQLVQSIALALAALEAHDRRVSQQP